jgi:hypothetical protein
VADAKKCEKQEWKSTPCLFSRWRKSSKKGVSMQKHVKQLLTVPLLNRFKMCWASLTILCVTRAGTGF